MTSKRAYIKATNERVTQELLDARAQRSIKAGFGKQKWVMFCEELLKRGYTLELYEARRTVSKYITISHPDAPGKRFKVRFSNHEPIKYREIAGDCDFFVGRTHLSTTTTRDAYYAVVRFFGKED